jgi:hypothetical protein
MNLNPGEELGFIPLTVCGGLNSGLFTRQAIMELRKISELLRQSRKLIRDMGD